MGKNDQEIAKISLKIDGKLLKNIAREGRLEEFITTATEIFATDLKAELVKESASAVSTSLYLYDDDFGTGPRPPIWHNIARIDALASRVSALEQSVLRSLKG